MKITIQYFTVFHYITNLFDCYNDLDTSLHIQLHPLYHVYEINICLHHYK